MRYQLHLPFVRFTNIYRIFIIIDFLTISILWIIGAALNFQTNAIEQITKFKFDSSVFDNLLLVTIKSITLFIIISELEESYKQNGLINKIKRMSGGSGGDESDSEEMHDADTNEIVVHEGGGKWLRLEIKSDTHMYLSSLRKLLHALIVIVTIVSLAYSAVKLSIVIKSDEKNLHELFIALIGVSLAFTAAQFLFTCLSWTFLRKLESFMKVTQCVNEDLSNGTAPKKANLSRLLSLSKPERGLIGIGLIALVISSSTQIVTPYLFGKVIDSAIGYPDLVEMNRAVLIMFAIYVVGAVASGIRSWLFEMAGQRVVARLRRDVFHAILRQDIKFFDANRTGELTSRMSSDSQVLQNAVTVNISVLLRYLIQIVGSFAFMLSLQASLTGLLVAVIPIVSILTVYYGRYLRNLRKVFQDNLATANVTAEEAISSTRTVRSFGAEKKIEASYERDISNSFLVGVKLAVAQGGFMFVAGILTAGGLAVVLWYGGKLVHEQKLTTGVLSSFLMYTLQVAMAFAFLMSLYGDFMQAVGASQRIFELLDKQPEILLNRGVRPKNGDEDEAMFDGSFSLCDVKFAYPTRKDTCVLDSLSFQVRPNQTVALVGPSGGGKSTIFSLIERFYDPDVGEIKIGPQSINLKEIDLGYLHEKVAIVSQEPVLFGGTIKDNIAFGVSNGSVSMEQIVEVAKLANAHGFISEFEQGYDTLVGERGIRLSGGQKQRIAIARALLLKPKLLLLDEATSALDAESEHLVQEAMNKAMKGRTVCVIAHRLSTVRNADLVIVLDGGRIVEQGTHDELIALNGIYKQLVVRQMSA